VRLAGALLALALAAPGARAQILPDGECAGVYWDLTAAFLSGDRVYARVLVTRAGPTERNAAGVGFWIAPDGKQTQFQNGRSEGDFELTAAGDRIRIGSTRLELGDHTTVFEVDNDKRGVKLRLELEATPQSATAPIFPGDPQVDLIGLGHRTAARVWRTGMAAPRDLRGFATLVRTRHRACESDRSAQRVDVHRLPPGGASLLIHERLVDGTARSWLGWRDSQGGLRTLRPEAVALEDWRADGDGPPLPHRLRPTGGALAGEVAVGAAQLSIDPLEALPRLVRMLYWFGARPRRIWADATSDLAASASEPLPRGAAIASFSFLRPPEVPSQSSAASRAQRAQRAEGERRPVRPGG
jgi:hypothetical protein